MIKSDFISALHNSHHFIQQLIGEADFEDRSTIEAAIVDMLNTALVAELMSSLRYSSQAIEAQKLGGTFLAVKFQKFAIDEKDHADKLASRIIALNDTPHMSPRETIQQSNIAYTESTSIQAMIQESYTAENIAIATYQTMLKYVDKKDPDTAEILDEILDGEEEQADDLLNLASKLNIEMLEFTF